MCEHLEGIKVCLCEYILQALAYVFQQCRAETRSCAPAHEYSQTYRWSTMHALGRRSGSPSGTCFASPGAWGMCSLATSPTLPAPCAVDWRLMTSHIARCGFSSDPSG